MWSAGGCEGFFFSGKEVIRWLLVLLVWTLQRHGLYCNLCLGGLNSVGSFGTA